MSKNEGRARSSDQDGAVREKPTKWQQDGSRSRRRSGLGSREVEEGMARSLDMGAELLASAGARVKVGGDLLFSVLRSTI